MALTPPQEFYGYPFPKNIPGMYQTSSGIFVPILADASGYLLVNVAAGGGGGGGGTFSTFGAPFPALGTAAGAETLGGNMGPLSLDAGGNLKVNVEAGSITVTPITSTTVSPAGPTVVGTSSSLALAANANRKRLIIQNTGTTNLYILFGAGSASVSNYHLILPAGGVANDGSSTPYVDVMWLGAIQWASSAPGGQGNAFENT